MGTYHTMGKVWYHHNWGRAALEDVVCGEGLWLPGDGGPSNTNLPELKFQCFVCCINLLFTFIKGQRSGRVLLS